MPQYFFHTRYKRYIPDPEGINLPDRNTAWKQATRMAGHIFRDIDGNLEPGREWRLEVNDHSGKMLFTIRFSAELYDD